MYLGHLVPVYSFVQDGLASGVGGWRVCVWLEGMCGQGVWLMGVGSWMGVGGFGVCVVELWNECGFGWCVVGGMCVVDGCGWLWGVGGRGV